MKIRVYRICTMKYAILLVLITLPLPNARAAERLAEIAEVRQPADGEPKASDVILRSLRIRPINDQDSHDTMQALRAQIVTMPKKGDRLNMDQWVRRTRQTIAMAYACGGHCMVPWDVYMPRDAPRYFGRPQQYADLFAFIRACSRYLDGYGHAEATGHGVPTAAEDGSDAVRVIGCETVTALARAIPGDRGAAVAVHLVDWSDVPGPFKLTLNPERLFGDRPLHIRLLRPASYDRAAHAAADDSRDYSGLSQAEVLVEGRVDSVEIPALDPWGIVVVEGLPSG